MPEILKLEDRYPCLFVDSYGRKETETLYGIHIKDFIVDYPGDNFG